ncbi:MAG: hypothetical protein ACYC23_17830 [Limisphaerales bacterium]
MRGGQEGRHLGGYYHDYCCPPLCVFAGQVPLWARLCTADRDAANDAVEALSKVATAIRRSPRRDLPRAGRGLAVCGIAGFNLLGPVAGIAGVVAP